MADRDAGDVSDGIGWTRSAGERNPAATYKEGAEVRALVTGIGLETFDVLVSIARYDDRKDREKAAGYLKPPKPLTLGELLSSGREDDKTG